VDEDATPSAGWAGDLNELPPAHRDALMALRDLVDVLTGLDPAPLDGRQAAVVAHEVGSAASRLGVMQARVLAVIEADGLWSVEAGSLPAWVAGRLRMSHRAARAQVQLGRELREHLPLTAAAAGAGEITAEHAQVLARVATTTEQRLAVLADPAHECNEAFLVRQACLLPVDVFRVMVSRWAKGADPDADDRGYVQMCDREYFTVDRLPDGYHVAGFLAPEHGQALRTALQAVTPVPAAGDRRTADQRRAQAVGDLARLVIDHGLVGTGRAVCGRGSRCWCPTRRCRTWPTGRGRPRRGARCRAWRRG
jgi:hypothetical protein